MYKIDSVHCIHKLFNASFRKLYLDYCACDIFWLFTSCCVHSHASFSQNNVSSIDFSMLDVLAMQVIAYLWRYNFLHFILWRISSHIFYSVLIHWTDVAMSVIAFVYLFIVFIFSASVFAVIRCLLNTEETNVMCGPDTRYWEQTLRPFCICKLTF